MMNCKKMIKKIREVVGFFITYVAYWFQKRKNNVLSFYFHDPEVSLFEGMVKWLSKKVYRFIDMDELIKVMESSEKPTEKLAFISFDDGWASNLDLLPVCEKYKVPIMVFVATGPIKTGAFWWEYVIKTYGYHWNLLQEFKAKDSETFNRDINELKRTHDVPRSALTIDQLIQMSKHPYVSIQSHTVSHPIITKLSDEALLKELVDSKKELEEITGKPIDIFSYPNGTFGQREKDAVKAAGYKYSFSTEQRFVKIGNEDNLSIPRMALNMTGGVYENMARVFGGWQKIFPIKI